MAGDFVRFSSPDIGIEEINEVIKTLKSKWITTGPKTKIFEERFRDYLGAPSALALNSCTAGLHTALMVSGVEAGDEVITTPMTFAASVNVIEHVGAKPVFVDINDDTLNLDAEKIERKITKKTKAIMPVHFSGHPVDLDLIEELAAEYNLIVIEDAAHALPSKYKGKYIGSRKNLTSFSFYATKNLTTGEGGMLTGPPELIEEAQIISLHGMNKDAWKRYDKGSNWYYEILLPGNKYNMTDIQASLGIHQLDKLNSFQRKRENIVKKYNEAFSKERYFETPIELPEVEHSWHLYVLRLNLDSIGINRNEFIEDLAERGIGTSVHFIPMHLHPYYKNKYKFKPEDFPIAYKNYERIISLPLYPKLTNNEVDKVIDSVLKVAKEKMK